MHQAELTLSTRWHAIAYPAAILVWYYGKLLRTRIKIFTLEKKGFYLKTAYSDPIKTT